MHVTRITGFIPYNDGSARWNGVLRSLEELAGLGKSYKDIMTRIQAALSSFCGSGEEKPQGVPFKRADRIYPSY